MFVRLERDERPITVDGQTNNLEKCHSRIGDPVKFSEVTRAVERVYSQVLREE